MPARSNWQRPRNDFAKETARVCQNKELVRLLNHRSREKTTLSLAEVQRRLGLT
jgi:hypothetical protein